MSLEHHSHEGEHGHGGDGHVHEHGPGDHSHAPAGAVEDYSTRKHPEFVAIDIGGEVGALIIETDAAMHGNDIEISPTGRDDSRTHKQVLERDAGGRPAFTAVFDGLKAGTYSLWVNDEARAREVKIEGGSIAQLDWRGLD